MVLPEVDENESTQVVDLGDVGSVEILSPTEIHGNEDVNTDLVPVIQTPVPATTLDELPESELENGGVTQIVQVDTEVDPIDTPDVPVATSDDADQDGIPDHIEGVSDIDADGILNYLDLDSDNDGIPDHIEAGPVTEVIVQSNSPVSLFSDESGPQDSDSDGVANYLDLDSDGDGIPDLVEAGGLDADFDGQVDSFVDINADGLDDGIAVVPLGLADTDSDGVPNYLDTDSDQDGVPDSVEYIAVSTMEIGGDNSSTEDADQNGWVDVAQVLEEAPIDTDLDETPDYIDLDSDNNGVFDITENGGGDVDADGMVDLPIGAAQVEVIEPDAGAAEDGPVLLVGGGGCSVSGNNSSFDPLLCVASVLFLLSLYRRKAKNIICRARYTHSCD